VLCARGLSGPSISGSLTETFSSKKSPVVINISGSMNSADTMRSRIVSLFSEALATAKIPVLDVASRYSEVGAALLPLIHPVTVEKYGIELTEFRARKRECPAGSGESDRPAFEYGGGGEFERLREVPDGAGDGSRGAVEPEV